MTSGAHIQRSKPSQVMSKDSQINIIVPLIELIEASFALESRALVSCKLEIALHTMLQLVV